MKFHIVKKTLVPDRWTEQLHRDREPCALTTKMCVYAQVHAYILGSNCTNRQEGTDQADAIYPWVISQVRHAGSASDSH